MAIEITVDSLDSVDESLRGVYVEADGQYMLDPDKYAEHKALGLKKKNSELIGKEKQLKAELAKFEKFKDLDLDALEEFFEAREQGQQDNGKGKPDGEQSPDLRRLNKQIEKLQGQLKQNEATWQMEREQMVAELRHYKLTVPLKEIALKAGVLPDDVDLALLETAKRFRLQDDGRILVVDEDGDPTTDTPERFFKEVYRDMRPKFYAATGAGGSGAAPGAKGGTGGNKTMKRTAFDALNAIQRAKAIKDGVQIVD